VNDSATEDTKSAEKNLLLFALSAFFAANRIGLSIGRPSVFVMPDFTFLLPNSLGTPIRADLR
jgi:hypothetical protein